MAKIFLSFFFIYKIACELIGVIQVNRHGARAPSNFGKESSSYMHGINNYQLSAIGYNQLELLGQWTAERYMHYDYKLLNEDYSSSQIIFKASPKERTIFSGIAFIKGMFPKSNVIPDYLELNKNKINNEIKIQNDNLKLREKFTQISLKILHPSNDKIFHSQHCRTSFNSSLKLKELLIDKALFNITHEEIKLSVHEIKDQAEYLFNDILPHEIYSNKFFRQLTSFIIPMQFHTNNELFSLTEHTLYLIQKFQLQKWYGTRIKDSSTHKIINSAFFNEILSYLEEFIKGSLLKYILYSGHDSTIISIISNLLSEETLSFMLNEHKIYYNFLQPKFAASFIFELHSYLDGDNIKKYFIRILYNNELLKKGYREGIIYNEFLDGIEFPSLKIFFDNLIDPEFENLICHN